MYTSHHIPSTPDLERREPTEVLRSKPNVDGGNVRVKGLPSNHVITKMCISVPHLTCWFVTYILIFYCVSATFRKVAESLGLVRDALEFFPLQITGTRFPVRAFPQNICKFFPGENSKTFCIRC